MGERSDGRRGERHLEPAADDEHAPETPQLGERELEADREQEQNHPDLGELLDLVGVPDPPEAARPDEGARHEEAGDGGEAEPVQDEDDREGRPEEHDEIPENVELGHGASRALRYHAGTSRPGRRDRGRRPCVLG